MVHVVKLMTFIKPFSSIIKNYTKVFRDIESSDTSHKCYYRL